MILTEPLCSDSSAHVFTLVSLSQPGHLNQFTASSGKGFLLPCASSMSRPPLSVACTSCRSSSPLLTVRLVIPLDTSKPRAPSVATEAMAPSIANIDRLGVGSSLGAGWTWLLEPPPPMAFWKTGAFHTKRCITWSNMVKLRTESSTIRHPPGTGAKRSPGCGRRPIIAIGMKLHEVVCNCSGDCRRGWMREADLLLCAFCLEDKTLAQKCANWLHFGNRPSSSPKRRRSSEWRSWSRASSIFWNKSSTSLYKEDLKKRGETRP